MSRVVNAMTVDVEDCFHASAFDRVVSRASWAARERRIVEIPESTVAAGGLNLPIAGGGYFRLLPYVFTRWGTSRLNAQGVPAVFCIHPWEIDADQPRLPVPRLTAFRHYSNSANTLERLARMVNECAFDTVTATLDVEQPAAAPGMRFAHAK